MSPPSSFRGVLLDLDGVLVDSRRPISRCLNLALEQNGLAPRPEPELYRLIGPGLHEVFEGLVAAQRRDGGDGAPALVERCVLAYRDHYRRVSLETPAFDGIATLLARLAERLPLAVATSKPSEFARPILENLGLAGVFRDIVGPGLDAVSEPKARTVGRALPALGAVEPARVAMVGDRHHDVSAARAHGLVAVGVLWGIGDAEELRAAGAAHLVETPESLAALLLGAD